VKLQNPPVSIAAAAKLLLEHLASNDNGYKSPSLNELWPIYWDTEGRHLTSADRTEQAWRHFCHLRGKDGIEFGDRPALSVNSERVEELRMLMHERPTRRKRKPRNGTVNRDLVVLRRLFSWAHEKGKIPYNPLPSITMEDETDGIPKTKIRTEEELNQLLGACKGDLEMRTLILVLYDGMMRKMEVIGLRRDQVIRKPNGSAIVELTADGTKTKRARRPRLTKRALGALDALPNYGPYYFSRPDGKRYNDRYLYELYESIVHVSGLKGVNGESITFHTLRHSSM
jgi:integrase